MQASFLLVSTVINCMPLSQQYLEASSICFCRTYIHWEIIKGSFNSKQKNHNNYVCIQILIIKFYLYHCTLYSSIAKQLVNTPVFAPLYGNENISNWLKKLFVNKYQPISVWWSLTLSLMVWWKFKFESK